MDPLLVLSISVGVAVLIASGWMWARSRDGHLAFFTCALLFIIAGQMLLSFAVARVEGVDRFWNHSWAGATLLISALAVVTLFMLHRLASERVEAAARGRRAERALSESNQRFTLMADSAPVLIWITDAEGRGVYFNKPWLTFRGRTIEEERRDGCVAALHPDDQQLALEACHAAIRSRLPFSLEFRLRRHDGEHRWMLTHGVPMFLTDGSFVGCIASAVDITERKAGETRQRLMMAELDHRVKNNLAAVMSLAEQTLRAAGSLDEFRQVFIGRLHALAHTHEALAHNKWEGIRFDEAARLTLGAFRRDDPPRVRIEGEAIVLPPRFALPVSLALHELATNAAKYGSLSTPAGRVDLTWARANGTAHVLWVESGGPLVRAPERIRTGVGLIRGMVRFELGGEVEIEYPPTGLVCRMRLPLAESQPEPPGAPEPRS